ncbi:MAG TPA: hypothetical protein VGL40_04080 [Bacillota bacterium]|jgi:hypothetical protein
MTWLILGLTAVLIANLAPPAAMVVAEGAPSGDAGEATPAASNSGVVTVKVKVKKSLQLTVDTVREERDGGSTVLIVSGTVKANTGWELLASAERMSPAATSGSVTLVNGDGLEAALDQPLERGRPTKGYRFEHRFRIEGEVGQYPLEALSYVIVPTP